MKHNKSNRHKAIHLKKLNYIIGGLTLVLSVMLLFASFQLSDSYYSLKETTGNYINWKMSASDMQVASDYLTEQARCFVVTGDRIYLNNYFEENNVTKRRENALNTINEYFSGTKAYSSLKAAMNESVNLMEREFYAMRLTIASLKHNVNEYPDEIKNTKLSSEDKKLSPDRQQAKARSMMFDYIYKEKKDVISDNMQQCLAELDALSENLQQDATIYFQRILHHQQTLIIIVIICIIVIVLLTMRLIIKPLMKAITHINNEDSIPAEGSYEFRFLAKTYNRMFEAGLKSRKHLFYEATHDKLSDTYNRRGYEIICEKIDINNCALLLIDVDHFKSINDTYGHPTGDKVIVKVANILKDSFQDNCYVCRMGGDEFAIIITDTDGKPEPIRDRINYINNRLQNSDDGLPKTSLSVGVAFGGSKHSTGDIFKDADTALYVVKEHGRNDCAFFS